MLGEEGAPVVLAEALPELGGDGSQPVDRGTPVAGLRDGALDVGVQHPAELRERADPGDARGRRHGGRRGQAVDPGDLVVPRHRVQGAALAVGGDRDVDHRQAGADEQQVAVGQLLGPRVRDEPLGVTQALRRPVGAGAGAGGEHHGAGHDRLPRGEAYDEPVAATVDADARVVAALEPRVAGELRGVLQQRLDVVAVDPAGHEVLRLGLGVVVAAHPPEEVLGVARERAHPAGRHVEQVPLVGGGVRRAATRRRRRVHQRHPVAGGQPGHQVRGGQRAGSAGPDHHDRTVAFTTAHGPHL